MFRLLTRLQTPATAGVLIAVAGALIVALWWVRVPSLMALPYFSQLRLHSGLMLLAGGLALAARSLQHARGKPGSQLADCCAALLILYPALVQSQTIFGIHLGLDFLRVPVAPTPEIPHPGRMAPNAAIAFISAGAALYLMRRAAAARGLPVKLAMSVTTVVAFSAVLGHMLGLEQLYRLASYNSMLPPTAACLCVFSLGVWRLQGQLAAPDLRDAVALERRIAHRTAATLAVVALAAGVAAFAVMRISYVDSTMDDARISARTNAIALENTLQNALWIPRTVAGKPAVALAMAALQLHPEHQEARARLELMAEDELGPNLEGLRFLGADGQVLAQAGELRAGAATMINPLDVSGLRAELRWLEGYVLHVEADVVDGGRHIGRVVTEQRMWLFDQMLAALGESDSTADALVCSRSGPVAVCAPSRLYIRRYTLPMFDAAGQPAFPMSRALLGESGALSVKDLRGVPVVAGYAPIGKLGLGLVVKSDVNGLYASLKERLQLVALLVAGLVAAGAWSLRARVRPLVQAVVQAQQRLVASERRLTDVLGNIPAMVGHFDADERCLFANDLALKVHGLSRDQALGRRLREGVSREAYALHRPHIQKVLQGERTSFEGCEVRDGRTSHYQVHLEPERDAEGQVCGFYLLTFDVTALRLAERRMAELALSDPLTGLANRRRLDERLPEALARARRQRTGLGLMFLDVDHFKRINDTLGHAAGDAVLLEFGARLKATVRGTDFVARLAGDEFVVVLEGLHGVDECDHVAAKIVAAARRPMPMEGVERTVTTSIGVAFLPAGQGADPAALLALADRALYETKARGRDGHTCLAFGVPAEAPDAAVSTSAL